MNMREFQETQEFEFNDNDAQGPHSNLTNSDQKTVSSLLRRDKSQASISQQEIQEIGVQATDSQKDKNEVTLEEIMISR